MKKRTPDLNCVDLSRTFCSLTSLVLFLSALCGVIFPLVAKPQEFENITNETFQTNFRPGHTISLYAGLQQSNWQVNEATFVSGVSKTVYSPTLLVRYGFHINLRKKFGFIVGTSCGATLENSNIQGFQPQSSFLFPSLGFGFVHWPEPKVRFTAFAEYSALWYPGMKAKETSTESSSYQETIDISSIADVAFISATLDWYVWKRSGVGILFGWRFVDDGFVGAASENRKGKVDFKNNGFNVSASYALQLGEQTL